MRQKINDKPENSKDHYGVADGFDFGLDIEDNKSNTNTNTNIDDTSEDDKDTPLEDNTSTINKSIEIDPNRNYSPYYTPKPKLGSKGGILGRGAVAKSERKVQFSLTCTPAQKELFSEAAKKDHRKLPDFICLAVEEYIKNHNL